jgi:hypothetical protein
MPVAGLFGAAAKPPKATEKPEPAAREPEDRPAWERAAETGSAPADITVDLGPDPLGLADAPAAAPRPRDADDEDALEPEAEPAASRETEEEDEPAAEREPEPSTASAAEEPGGEGPQVRILSGTKRYHRTDCALIEDIGDEADDLESLSRAEAKSRGCTPCLVCQPDREHARD